jgi:hypothetical protein
MGPAAPARSCLPWLGAATLAGVGLRTLFPDVNCFEFDQAMYLHQAARLASGDGLPLEGPHVASYRFTLGPFYYWVLGLFRVVSRDPAVLEVLQGLLGALAIPATWALGRRLVGPVAGLVAAALVAVHPGMVVNGRPLWNPALIPLAAALFLLSLVRWRERKRSGALVAGLAAGLAAQIHLSLVPLLLLIPLGLFAPRRRRLPDLLVFLAVFGLTQAPVVYREVAHGFEGVRSLLKAAGGRLGGDGLALPVVWGRALFAGPLGLPGVLQLEAAPARALLVAGLIAFEVSALSGLAGVFLRAPRFPGLFLLAAIAVPVLALSPISSPLSFYYFDVIVPAKAVLAAWAWSRVIGRWGGRAALPVGAVLLALFAAPSVLWLAQVRSRAEISLDIGRCDLRRPSTDPGPGPCLIPAQGMRRAWGKALGRKRGWPPGTAAARVHGLRVWELFTDQGFWVSFAARRGNRPASDAQLYVGAADPELLPRPDQPSHAVRPGPWVYQEFVPRVRLERWEVGLEAESGGNGDDRPPFGWTPWPLPARGTPDPTHFGYFSPVRWPRPVMRFRGPVQGLPEGGRELVVLVVVRGLAEADRFEWNGAPIEPVLQRRYFVSRLWGLRPPADRIAAENVLAFRVTSAPTDREFDVDVYDQLRTRDRR